MTVLELWFRSSFGSLFGYLLGYLASICQVKVCFVYGNKYFVFCNILIIVYEAFNVNMFHRFHMFHRVRCMINDMSLNYDQFREIIDRKCNGAVSIQAALNYDKINDKVMEATSEIEKQVANDGFESVWLTKTA